MSWLKKFLVFINPSNIWHTVRARDIKGRFIADDPSTKKNEAYTRVRKKRGRPRKKK